METYGLFIESIGPSVSPLHSEFSELIEPMKAPQSISDLRELFIGADERHTPRQARKRCRRGVIAREARQQNVTNRIWRTTANLAATLLLASHSGKDSPNTHTPIHPRTDVWNVPHSIQKPSDDG